MSARAAFPATSTAGKALAGLKPRHPGNTGGMMETPDETQQPGGDPGEGGGDDGGNGGDDGNGGDGGNGGGGDEG